MPNQTSQQICDVTMSFARGIFIAYKSVLYRAYAEQRSCRSSWEKREKELTRTIVEKDLHIQSLNDTIQAMKMEVQKKEEELTG